MAQTIPAEPLDIEMHCWEVVGAGEFAPAIRVEFSERLDLAVLESALEALMQSEPVLACRLVVDAPSPHWQPLERIVPSVLTATESLEDFERLSSGAPKALVGPQLWALLLRGPSSDRLLLKISHEAGDDGAVLYCLERLAAIYTQQIKDPAFVPSVSAGGRGIGQVLKFVPKKAYLKVVRDWVQFGLSMSIPKASHNIGLPTDSDHPWHYVTREVDAARLAALSQYGRARGSTLNDVFLAAFYRTLVAKANWDGKSALRVTCTIDLRRWFLPDRRVDSVCNLSSAELPFLGRNLGVDYEDTLGRVTRIMNGRKRSYPGIAIALLCPKIGDKGITEKRLAGTRKNYEGAGMPIFTNAGVIEGDRVSFDGQVPAKATFLAIKGNLPRFVVAISGYNGTLTVSCCASDSARPKIESFLDGLMETLPA